MLAPSELLAHRGDLGADDLRLCGRHQPLALVQRQADGLGDRKIIALNSGHLGLGHDARPQLGYQLHSPYQLRHRSYPGREASGYPTTIASTTLHALPIGVVLRQAGVPDALASRLEPAQQILVNAVKP